MRTSLVQAKPCARNPTRTNSFERRIIGTWPGTTESFSMLSVSARNVPNRLHMWVFRSADGIQPWLRRGGSTPPHGILEAATVRPLFPSALKAEVHHQAVLQVNWCRESSLPNTDIEAEEKLFVKQVNLKASKPYGCSCVFFYLLGRRPSLVQPPRPKRPWPQEVAWNVLKGLKVPKLLLEWMKTAGILHITSPENGHSHSSSRVLEASQARASP